MFKLHAASRLRILAAPDAPIGGAVEDDLDTEPEWYPEATILLQPLVTDFATLEARSDYVLYQGLDLIVGGHNSELDAKLDKFLKSNNLTLKVSISDAGKMQFLINEVKGADNV